MGENKVPKDVDFKDIDDYDKYFENCDYEKFDE